jgi:YidC/Oxa1 family membrane protein insertase
LLDLSGVEFLPDQEGLTVHPGEEGTLRLTAELDGGIRIAKVFRFSGDSYGILFDLEYEGLAEGGQAILSWEYGIARTEKKPPGGFFGMSGAQIVRTVAFMNEERIQVEPEEEHKDKGLLRWAGIVNSYFFLAIAPTEEGYYNVELFGQDSSQDMFSWNEASFTIGTRVEGAGKFSTMIYAGPLDYEHLATYERDLEQGIDLGWPVIRDISKVLLTIFVTVHQYIPNYGWVLVIFAFCIKILVYPLTHKSYSSMAKMQEVQPKITGLREKYKNDQQRLTQETMKLYKEEGVNPLGGCLPIVLQMPVFFALYKLFYSIELRHEPFILWINDLSVPD